MRIWQLGCDIELEVIVVRDDGITKLDHCATLLLEGLKLAKRYEPVREKTNNLGFRPGPSYTGLHSLRLKKKKDCTIRLAKTKALISCALTAQLICAFGFVYASS